MATLPDADLLQRLMRLNHERAAEQQGHVRHLRPAYQAPGIEHEKLYLPAKATSSAVARSSTQPGGNAPQPRPTELAQQMQALRDALRQSGQPLTSAEVASRLKRVKSNKIAPLIQTLAVPSLLCQTPGGAYVLQCC